MSLIRKPGELTTPKTIKVLVYGQPGIGKTTLGLSTPSPLLLDFDGGVHRVNPMHQTDTVQITSWEDCLNVLKEDLGQYRTIIIDTAGKMLDYMALYLIHRNGKLGKSNGSLTLQGYGERKAEFISFLKTVSMMGKHLVFIAHEREEKDGDQKIVRPEIGGSSAGDLIKELDLVGYMEAIGKKKTISFDPCEKYYAKNTCQLPALMDVPQLTDSRNEFLTGVINAYSASVEKRAEMAGNYSALIDLIKDSADNITDAGSCNEFVDWAMSLEHIWDSKLQAGLIARNKAKELGLTLNKSKKYEPATEAANV